MNIGDKIYIRNNSGVLTAEITERLPLQSFSRRLGDAKLPQLNHPRMEFHKRGEYEYIVTLCDMARGVPFDIWIMYIQQYETPQIFKGICRSSETADMCFVTIDTEP